MKKILLIVIGIIIITGGGFIYYKSKTSAPFNNPSQAAIKNITLAEVATHNNANSCWTIVDNKVYDVTSWIDQHPGGDQAIISMCGLDASAPFARQHGSNQRAQSALVNFLIGNLVQ